VPELAEVHPGLSEVLAKAATEPRSRVTFEIEPDGDQVKLTVITTSSRPRAWYASSSPVGGRTSSPTSSPDSKLPDSLPFRRANRRSAHEDAPKSQGVEG
jgi:hypothetical protein